jgi:hypothetical protein
MNHDLISGNFYFIKRFNFNFKHPSSIPYEEFILQIAQNTHREKMKCNMVCNIFSYCTELIVSNRNSYNSSYRVSEAHNALSNPKGNSSKP